MEWSKNILNTSMPVLVIKTPVIKDIVKKNVIKGDIICAQFETDNLIVAGVSNWGAFGICAGLSLLNDKALLFDDDKYEELMKAIVKAGAVDGR